MTKSLVIVVIFLIIAGVNSAPQTCGQTEWLKADSCARHSNLINHVDRRLPHSLAELDDMLCSTISDDIKCIGSFRHCLRPVAKTLFGVGYRNMKELAKAKCGSTQAKQTYLNAISCFQTRSERHKLFNLIEVGTAGLDWVADESKADDLMGRLCCLQVAYTDHSRTLLSGICAPKNLQSSADLITSMISTIINVEHFCGKYSDMISCRREVPKAMDKYNELFQTVNTRHDHSPLMPVIRIMEKFDVEEEFKRT